MLSSDASTRPGFLSACQVMHTTQAGGLHWQQAGGVGPREEGRQQQPTTTTSRHRLLLPIALVAQPTTARSIRTDHRSVHCVPLLHSPCCAARPGGGAWWWQQAPPLLVDYYPSTNNKKFGRGPCVGGVVLPVHDAARAGLPRCGHAFACCYRLATFPLVTAGAAASARFVSVRGSFASVGK